MGKFLDTLKEKISKNERHIEQRNIIFLSEYSAVALIIAGLFDIYIGEHIVETITLFALAIVVPVSTLICLWNNKVVFCSKLQICFLTFIITPVTFFYGGGPKGGGVFWTAFTFMYIGIILYGHWRRSMIVILSLILFSEYGIYYYYPEYVYYHDERMMCIDALVSLVLVGVLIYSMLYLQKRLFREANWRAKEETRRAEELNRSQNLFFSSMSHEIRTPINSILGLNELIIRDDDATDEIKRNASNIQGSGRMLLALINDILDVSKLEAGKLDITPVNYHLGDMISEIVNMIWLLAEKKGLKLVVDVDPSLPSELFGDEVRVRQILVNILNNAVKYTEKGTVTLHMEREEVKENQVLIVFSVTDTGIGIKQDDMPYLFDAFQRVDENNNRHIEGTGLGLSIVKQLVEAMGGEIKVNSIYTEGSTFTVSLWQGITSRRALGDVSIKNYGATASIKPYESGFTAPDVRILIVDDNEMNLFVERELLTYTLIKTDTANNGEEALKFTLENKYDVILMDHLMPGMDGIDCLKHIRRQKYGLNHQTPVIVLTANAGAENRELYSKSGFDDYLIKPVSGKQLEEMLLKHLPADMVILSNTGDISKREMNTAKSYSRKIPLLVTTCSMADIPGEILKNYQLDIIPFSVRMNDRYFQDVFEAGSDELVHYMNEDDNTLMSYPPTVEDYERFFANGLKKAHQILHITITTGMSKEFENAGAAAKAFDNVTVFNSEYLSGTAGMMVMVAYQMAQRGESIERIMQELEALKERMHCSFVVSETKYLVKRNYINESVHNIMFNLSLRPYLQIKNDKFGLGGILIGHRHQCYKKYIAKALPKSADPDTDIIFVTYVDLPEETLSWIEEEIRSRFDFKRIVYNKASAAISLNCGSGTFGLLYMDKGAYSYNLSSMFAEEEAEIPDESYDEPANETSLKWYEGIEGIDGAIALKNSGSEDSLRMLLKLFYDSITQRAGEIEGFFDAKDWKNYTIKVHALKSSSKLVGAMELSDMAQKLENAGKAEDTEYILEKHNEFLEAYKNYKNALSGLFGASEEDADEYKPLADPGFVREAYEEILNAAVEMDCDKLEEVFKSVGEYALPNEDKDKFKTLKEYSDNFDYDGIVNMLGEK
ncbi:MAG: DegV family EDD domain-containing protein [Lachnospiraceae bacterium]|nr:DegV family EDD domain-containing protein [Lachnospiraceae bacterium]